jgi:hypothetical protein
MERYYDLVERARDLLAADGLDAVSRDVWEAERFAATSGEAISGIGVALKRALLLDLPEDTRLAVLAALSEGARLWNEASQ